MAVRRGISILDLLPSTTDLAGFVPDEIVEQIGVLTVLAHRSTASDDFFLHEGTLQSIADALDIDTSHWVVRIPGLTQGLPFRLALRRSPAATGGQEPAPSLWTLDIEVWDVEVLIPGVRGAKQAGGAGVDPLHLVPAPGPDGKPQRVFLAARGTLRIAGDGAGHTEVQLVDQPDPFDPTAPTGAVIRLTARPPHFLFGGSRYGMTLDRFLIDLSHDYTPAEVVARGHDEAWEGVAFHEATLYFPPGTPLVHSLSISTRDVIVGDPGGLQGELRIEFGQDFADQFNTHVKIMQLNVSGPDIEVAETTPPPRGTVLEFAVPLAPDGQKRRVSAVFGIGDSIPGHSDLAIVGVWWQLPDGSEGNSAETPYFDAPTGERLRYHLRIGDPQGAYEQPRLPSGVPDGQTELSEVVVKFPQGAATTTANPPLVDVVIGTTTFSNAVHLRGPRERLAGVRFEARGGTNGTWTVGGGSAPAGSAAPAPNFVLPLLPEGTTEADVLLRTGDGVRRIHVEVVPGGPLAIGHQESATATSPSAVTVVGTGDATPTAILETLLAADFHATGGRAHADADASISGTHVTVAQGTIAEVEVPVPEGANDPLPTVTTGEIARTAAQVLFNYDEASPLRVVYPLDDSDPTLTGDPESAKHEDAARPMALVVDGRARPDGTTVVAQLRAWIGATPPAGRKYFVVGRTDDLRFNGTLAENTTYNDQLATERRDAVVQALLDAGVADGDIERRIETAAPPASLPASAPARFGQAGRLALPTGQVTTPPSADHPAWNGRWTPDGGTSSAHAAARDDRNRAGYRTAEILFVDPGGGTTTPPSTGTGVPTNMLVPGPDGDPPKPKPTTTTEPPPTDYRVRLRVRWDSPTVVTLADAIPTEAEALVAWKAAAVELPPSASSGATTLPKPTGADFWEVVLHWTYDARTGQTEVTGSLALPSGTVVWTDDSLAGALAFGPAFTALLNPVDTVQDANDQSVLVAALIGAGAIAGGLINSGAGPTDPHSTVEIEKITIDYKWDGDTRVSATLDYTVDLRVNVGVVGTGSLIGHTKLKYKGVGLRFDTKASGLGGLALTYDSMSVDVVDPGTWSLGGPLGNLIRVAASRIGNGSTWMEFDLEFALDLGVVRLEGATIRVTLTPFGVELRGLTASVHIDGVLDGRGAVTVGDNGAFRALLALQIIPPKVGAYGALAVDGDFVAIEVGVQLPVGIPLGNTGLGVFGFMGRFVANGTRNLAGLTNPDPVQRELDWYVRSPEQKYSRLSGQFALGLGAVIGTLPDGGFIFNAEGTLALGFPDVSVIFGIDAHLATERKLAATESGTAPSSTFRILGLALFEPEAIMIAVRASYLIPKVLKLEAPISAYFPLQGSGDAWFIRIGTDNAPTRPGSPVTIVLLPGILDVRAWAFFMIEERELHGLGGTLVPLDLAQPLDFDGFSIGMGAGFDLRYKAGPFKLEVSAFLLVGIGTKPLLFAGAIGVRGELDLVVVSVGVDGYVHFYVTRDLKYIDGHFCGHVDFFFFSVGGCVDLRLGGTPPSDIPEPDSPLLGIDLCDHMSAVKGAASPTPTGDVPTVWPDTIAVLKFAHYIDDALGTTSDFNRRVAEPAALSAWSGATELKYAFRLASIELHKLTGADPNSDASWTRVTGPFDSAWWLPTHRRGVIVGGGETGPGTEEGRELGLFDWDPRAWSRWLGEGSQNLPGDPANTVGVVCEDPKPADPSCAFGKDAQFAFGVLARFDATPAPGSAFPSRFSAGAALAGGANAGTVAAVAGDLGWTYLPGGVTPLHGPVSLHGDILTSGWRLPSVRAQGQLVGTLPTAFTFSKPLVGGDVVLEICLDRQPQPIEPSETCDTMPKEPAQMTSFAGQSTAKYKGTSLSVTTFEGLPGLVIAGGPLLGQKGGGADSVAVDIVVTGDTTVTVTAQNAAGAETGRAQSSGPGRQTIVVGGPEIQSVTIDPGQGKPTLIEVCWRTGAPNPLSDLFAKIADGDGPRVVAIDAAGQRLVLQPQPVAQPAPTPVAAIIVRRCPKLVYHLPAPGDPVLSTSGGAHAGAGGWTGVEIGPWRRGDIALVAACGVTLEASQAQAQDQAVRDSLKGLLVFLATAALGDTPTHSVYLDARQTYQLRVAWQYQGFRPHDPGDEPGPPDPGAWIDASHVERYTFRTADFGVTAPPSPASSGSLNDPAQGGPGFDERVFDPRGLARFITRAAPDHEDPPHFLDDRVGFWFMADHLEPLVEKYDRLLQVKVLHTTPPPGSLHGVPDHPPGSKHPLDVTIGVHKKLETMTWFAADQRFVDAAVAAPCIAQPPAIGSSSISVTADLEPQSEYDLLMTVVPHTVGAYPEVVVARSHFATSRYRNPAGMLAALGFALPGGLRPPNDAIATGTLATGPLEVSDAALDAALGALGMDPWPLPAGPRTTLVWARPDGAQPAWSVIGVLLEADEPIRRAGFATGAMNEPDPPARLEVASLALRRTFDLPVPVIMPGLGGHLGGTHGPHVIPHGPPITQNLGTFAERVRNAAGTRILLVAPAPIPVKGGRTYDLELVFRENGATGSTGRAPLFDRPTVVFQEGE